MSFFNQIQVGDMLRAVASSLNVPVILILLLLTAAVIFCFGALLVEFLTEHRHLKVQMPQLVENLRESTDSKETDLAANIEKSGLLKSQKKMLTELTKHPELSVDMREALALRLVEEEQTYWDRRVAVTDLIAKLGPMFGLLGTLIPLGPGIIALGQGDTVTLSQSLLTAFDTTIVGLISAAAAMLISTIRKRWYANYMSILEALTVCVLELVKED